jgi:DNA recombination protein RmuC
MTLMWVTAGLLLLCIVFLVLWLMERATHAAHTQAHQATVEHWQQQLSQKDAELNQRLLATTQHHDSALAALRDERDAALQAQQLVQTDLMTTKQELASLRTELAKTTEHYAQWQQQLDEQFTTKFATLSQQTLDAMQEKLAKQAEETYQGKQSLLQKDVQSLLDPIKTLLKQQEEKVLNLNDMTIRETTSLKAQIQQSFEQTKALMDAKNRIVSVLTDNKGRGDWGELQLKQLLDASGLMEGLHYNMQVSQQDGGRPDVEIKLPNDRVIFIDVKTLLGTVERLNLAEDSPDTDQRQLNSLRTEIKKLATRAYNTQNKGSVDFVILYVPRESMLRVPLEQDANLLTDAMRDNVILASPLILMGLLKVVAQGWQQFEISRNAQEICEAGKELHKRFATFAEHFVDIRKKIDATQKQLDVAESSFSRMLMPGATRLVKLGAKSTKTLPSNLNFSDEAIL